MPEFETEAEWAKSIEELDNFHARMNRRPTAPRHNPFNEEFNDMEKQNRTRSFVGPNSDEPVQPRCLSYRHLTDWQLGNCARMISNSSSDIEPLSGAIRDRIWCLAEEKRQLEFLLRSALDESSGDGDGEVEGVYWMDQAEKVLNKSFPTDGLPPIVPILQGPPTNLHTEIEIDEGES